MKLFGFHHSEKIDVGAFERELQQLATTARNSQTRIAALKTYKSSIQRRLVTYTTIAYIASIAYIVKSIRTQQTTGPFLIMFVKRISRSQLILLLALPAIAFLSLYLFNLAFDILMARQDRALQRSLSVRKKKIEELKKITNFDETQNLLKKFNGANANEDSEKAVLKKEQGRHFKVEQRAVPKTSSMARPSEKRHSGGKTLQDWLLDLIIGSDHNENVENRLALICEKCFTHHGLAPPGSTSPAEIKYFCRQCGHLNNNKDTELEAPAELTSTVKTAAPITRVEHSREITQEDN